MELAKLRFLDENNEPYPDWEEKRLGDLGEIIGGGTPSTAIEDYWDGDIDWYSPAEIKSKYAISSVKKITEKGLKNSSAKLIPAGTVIVTTRATLGKMSILTKEGTTNQGFQSVVTGSSLLNEFLYYGQPKIEKYCIERAGGSTFKEISKTEFAKYPLLLPSLPEQEKIASFLSLLDERIEAYSALLDLSREEKKAYSQRLFSRSLRFTQDDGSPYPDWEEKRLGEVVEFRMGFTPSTSKEEYWVGENHWLSIKGLGDTKYIESGNKFISDEAASKREPFPAGTLLMSFKLSVGKLGITNIPLYTNEAICGFEESNSILTEFLYYTLDRTDFDNVGETAVKGQTLNTNSIKSIPLLLPSLPEQEKIASFLSALDDRVENLTLKLEALKQEKKAYSQRMLR